MAEKKADVPPPPPTDDDDQSNPPPLIIAVSSSSSLPIVASSSDDQQYARFMNDGQILIKHVLLGAKVRFVWVTLDLKCICTKDPDKIGVSAVEEKQVPVSSVTRIGKGKCTPRLTKLCESAKGGVTEDRVLAIFHGDKEKTLELEFQDEAERNYWYTCLMWLCKNAKPWIPTERESIVSNASISSASSLSSAGATSPSSVTSSAVSSPRPSAASPSSVPFLQRLFSKADDKVTSVTKQEPIDLSQTRIKGVLEDMATIADAMTGVDGVRIGDHKLRFKTFEKCFTGEEGVQWLIQKGYAVDEAEAVRIGEVLCQANVFRHVNDRHTFKNAPFFYRFSKDGGNSGARARAPYIPSIARSSASVNNTKELSTNSSPSLTQQPPLVASASLPLPSNPLLPPPRVFLKTQVQVQNWLTSIGLESLVGVFAENLIDGVALGLLTDSDLSQLGVTALGHRVKILNQVRAQQAGPIIEPEDAQKMALKVPEEKSDQRPYRRVRSLFRNESKLPSVEPELTDATKAFLKKGAMLKKYSSNRVPKKRLIYVTSNMEELVCRDMEGTHGPRGAAYCVFSEYKTLIVDITDILSGRSTKRLRRTILGRSVAKEECSFAIIDPVNTLDLEADSQTDRDKWVAALEELCEFTKWKTQQNKDSLTTPSLGL